MQKYYLTGPKSHRRGNINKVDLNLKDLDSNFNLIEFCEHFITIPGYSAKIIINDELIYSNVHFIRQILENFESIKNINFEKFKNRIFQRILLDEYPYLIIYFIDAFAGDENLDLETVIRIFKAIRVGQSYLESSDLRVIPKALMNEATFVEIAKLEFYNLPFAIPKRFITQKVIKEFYKSDTLRHSSFEIKFTLDLLDRGIIDAELLLESAMRQSNYVKISAISGWFNKSETVRRIISMDLIKELIDEDPSSVDSFDNLDEDYLEELVSHNFELIKFLRHPSERLKTIALDGLVEDLL